MLFTDEQMALINSIFPNVDNKEYEDYSNDEICDIIDEIGFVAVSCLDENGEPKEEKISTLNVAYSILDMLGEM